MEIRVSNIPPVCGGGVGKGVGEYPYLSHGLLIVWISFSVVLHINFNECNTGQLMTLLNEILVAL